MKTDEYWKKRAEQRIIKAERGSVPYLRKIAKRYRQAANSIDEEIRRMFETYRQDFTIEEAKAFLREEIPMTEYNHLKAILPTIQNDRYRKELTMRLNAQSYKYRITRAQYIKQMILVKLSEAADYERYTSSILYRSTIKESYYSTFFDIQKAVNIGFTVSDISNKSIYRLEGLRWYGRNYSASVWRNRGLVAESAFQVLETGILTGQSTTKMSKELMKKTYTNSMFNASRLIRTEVNYFSNQGTYRAYEEAGLDKYEYLATLDFRTSDICRKLDGKIFSLDTAEVGKNYPPMHPFCRSTTIPIIGIDGMKRMERRAARDLNTGKTIHIKDMDYEQWIKEAT